MKRTSRASMRLALLCAVLALGTVFGGRTLTAYAAPGDISTVAGTGNFNGSFSGHDGDGGPALQANIPGAWGLATAPGKYYFSQLGFNNPDYNRVREVQNGTISSVAGGVLPPTTDGVPATQSFLQFGGGTVADAAGDLFIAAGGNLRKVDAATQIITTIVTGNVGGVALDRADNLYISDPFGQTLSRYDPSSGSRTTVAGGGNPADGLGDGGPATAAKIQTSGVAFDAAGDIYISEYYDNRVRRVDASTGIITTIVGDGNAGFSGDGGPATSAEIALPTGVALDAAGNLYIADAFNNRIRKVDTNGIISTYGGGAPQTSQCSYSGDGGPSTSATMCFPTGVIEAANGDLYFTDGAGSLIRKIDSSGKISTEAGQFRKMAFFGDGGPASSALIFGVVSAAAPNGAILVDDYGNNRVRQIDNNGIITTVAGGGIGDGLPALSTFLTQPEGLTTDPTGNLIIADCGDSRVRKVGSNGIITSIAGTAASHGPGDGGPATSGGLECPAGVAYDSGGNLYIADSGANRVRKVDTSGVITTVAGTGAAGFSGDGGPAASAQVNAPSGVVVDAAGNVFIADTHNDRVRKIDTNGTITTVAGNGTEGGTIDGVAATKTSVVWPVGLALGPNGSLTIAASGFASIRNVGAKGTISTIAGNGIPGFSGDGGPGPLATLDGPQGIAYDSSGNLLIADYQNLVIRSVSPGTPPPPPPVTKKTVDCGATITQNLTLANDVGPCPGDGIVIGANGVHLDLNGHTISGTYGHTGQNVGIRATGQKDAKISNGTVTGFDAGVALISGSNNIVTGMTVANNQGGPNTGADTFGDGIVIFASSRNTVSGNSVLNNGPFDGIAMIGQGADNNLIQNNMVKDTTNFGRAFQPGTGLGIVTNPFLGFDRPRSVSLNANQIIGNSVISNGSAGISTISNVNGVVRGNLAEHNGFQSPFGGAFPGNGIGVTYAHNATPNTNELVENNQVYGNGRDGIQVVASGNKILNNIGNGNGAGAFHGFDFRDFDRDPFTFQANCSTNTWSGNQWGTGGFFPQCASNGGHPLSGTAAQPVPMEPQAPDGLGDPPPRQSP